MRKSKQNNMIQESYDIDSYSTPDRVSLYDTDDEYYSFNEGYDYYMAYPFYYNITEDKLIVGDAASTHVDMKQLAEFDENDNAKGRIWVTEDEEFSCVFALWNHERFAQYIGQLLCDYFSIDPTTAIYVEGDKLFYLIDMEEIEMEEQDDETKEELQQIHLANQEAKREALTDFRNDRDKNIADKIKDGGFKSEAEYRFYNGLNESKLLQEEDNDTLNKVRAALASYTMMLSKRYKRYKEFFTNFEEIFNYIVKQPKFPQHVCDTIYQCYDLTSHQPIIATVADNVHPNDILNIVGTNRQFIKDYFEDVLLPLNKELLWFTNKKIERAQSDPSSILQNLRINNLLYQCWHFNDDIYIKYEEESSKLGHKLDDYFQTDNNVADGVITYCERELNEYCKELYILCSYYYAAQLANLILRNTNIKLNDEELANIAKLTKYVQTLCQSSYLLI